MADVGLRWVAVPAGHTALLISDPPPDDGAQLTVCTESALAVVAAGGPGIAGRFIRREDGMLFSPRFPFRGGRDYLLVSSGHVIGRIRRDAAVARVTTRVLSIHPTHAVLAENHLRFCVEFSAPMSRGLASRRIHLFREGDPDPMDAAILPDELWDRAGRRVTLLLEPGRIKRGLVPHAESGSIIRDGVRYRLVVDPDCPDAAGAPLIAGAERAYIGGPAVREQIDPSQWAIDAERGRIDVRFERPLDHTLILRCLSVEGGDGTVRGRARVHECELGWTFVPDERLVPGEYSLVVQPRLQDAAGNAMHRLFDRDVRHDSAGPVEERRLPVSIR